MLDWREWSKVWLSRSQSFQAWLGSQLGQMLLPVVDAVHHQKQIPHLLLDQFCLGIPLQLLPVQSRNRNTSSLA